jgi:hypothetical protein
MGNDIRRVFEEMRRHRQTIAEAQNAIEKLKELQRVYGMDLPRIHEEVLRQKQTLSGAQAAIKQFRELQRVHGMGLPRMVEEARKANEALSRLRGAPLLNRVGSVTSWIAPSMALAQSFQQAFEPFATTLADAWGRFRANVVEPITRYQEVLAAIPKEHLEELRRILSTATSKFQEELEEEDKRIFDFLARRGWVGFEDYFTTAEFKWLMQIEKRRGKRRVDQIVCRKFRSRRHRLLTRMVRNWRRISYLAQRSRVIREAIQAHKKGKYALSIPSLLPLLDGLSARIVGKIIGPRKPILAKEAAELYHSAEKEVWSDCVLSVVTGLVYRHYDFAKRPPSTINRHAIMHGEVVGYPTEANSLRVILLIDTFARILTSKTPKGTP